jgi:hypothetical protein
MAIHFEVAIAGRKMEGRERIGKREGRVSGGVFCIEEWDDRGSETYRIKIPRYCYDVSEVIYLMFSLFRDVFI